MKTITHTSVLLCLLLCTGLVSCKKTVAGPAGPQGETGATGATGAPGNANVKSVIFSTSNWKVDSACKSYSYQYHTPDLTSTVLDKGAVMLYLGDNTGDNTNQWKPMPLSQARNLFTFEIETATVRIFVSQPDGKMPANPGSQKFKLVLIPPAS